MSSILPLSRSYLSHLDSRNTLIIYSAQGDEESRFNQSDKPHGYHELSIVIIKAKAKKSSRTDMWQYVWSNLFKDNSAPLPKKIKSIAQTILDLDAVGFVKFQYFESRNVRPIDRSRKVEAKNLNSSFHYQS
ncbi:hypothetical protein K3495_g4157 [Podosphaera aphanis]|nr:hypothetical protein K3495_g4157 [Podosphaera aphanis]